MLSIDFQSAGTWDSNTSGSVLNPGDPSGVVVGNLLICVTGDRVGGRVVEGGMTGWLQLHERDTNGSLEIFGRIADGTGSDSPAPDWSGTNQVMAVVLRYNGDVPADINDLIPASGKFEEGGTAGSSGLFVPAGTAPSVTDALVFVAVRKSKTSASNGAVIDTEGTEFTLRTEDAPDSTRNIMGVGDWQQVGAGANYDGDNWSHSPGGDAIAANSLLLYFEPEAGGGTAVKDFLIFHTKRQRQFLRR